MTNAHSRLAKIDIQRAVLFGILLLIIVVSSLLAPSFLTYTNLQNVLMQTSMIMLVGSAMTILMISGNFDLSVGTVLAFTGVMHAYLCKFGIPTNISIILVILIGACFGVINGFLVVNLKITPVIATLGTMYVAQGLAFIIAWVDGGANINSGLPMDFEALGRTMLGPIPLFLVFFVIIIAVFYFIYSKTFITKYAFVIGGNKVAAQLSGVKIGAVVSTLYILVGTLSGFAGVTLASRLGSGTPKVGAGFEFDVIIAVVLGGTSIYGGEGSFIGMIIGALIVGFVANILNIMDVQYFFQIVIKGVILITAVYINRKIKERLGQ